MRKWQSHKIVEAEPFDSFIPGRGDDSGKPGQRALLESGEEILLPDNFGARGEPEEGDYVVRYEDGYISWSPKEAFESGYSLAKS